MVISRSEEGAAVSLISLHGEKNEKLEKQDIVTSIEVESIFLSIKRYFLYQRMEAFF